MPLFTTSTRYKLHASNLGSQQSRLEALAKHQAATRIELIQVATLVSITGTVAVSCRLPNKCNRNRNNNKSKKATPSLPSAAVADPVVENG
mmetsp:Transcript_88786/g.133068  ORF Transcript_88786/g.133068 Transcript_88786/m.133068 type:complete len:91 (-) Transcript_88786:290-562(-)